MSLLEEIKERIRTEYGLAPRDEWDAALLRDLGLKKERHLDRDALRSIAGLITIEESHFLRHPEQLRYAADWLCERLRSNATAGTVRVWSAGCCRGEEPYSVAMSVLDRMPDLSQTRLDILGTDLSAEAIRIARRGVFGEWSMRGVDGALRARHFEHRGELTSTLSSEVKRFVRFENLSIQERLASFEPGSVALILFRNVSVYMEPEAAAKIYEGMAGALAPDGLLIISATDPRPERALFSPVDEGRMSVLRPSRGEKTAPFKIQRRQVSEPVAPRSPAVFPPPPTSLESLLREATILGDRGRLEEALEIADKAVVAYFANKAGFELRGRLRMAAHQARAAAADFERVLAIDADDHKARFWYAESLRSCGDYPRCIAVLEELSRRLVPLSDDDVLDDEDGLTVRDLRSAARSMTEAME